MKSLLILLASATTVQAALADPPIHFKSGITVYEGVVIHPLPDKVYKMTDEQYYRWALERNKKALARNRQAAYAPTGHTRYATVTESGGWSQSRFGGGAGAGGFGGNGGYAGYLDSGQQGGGGYGFRYAAGRPGNSMSTRGGSSSKSYTAEYREWPVFNGGDCELLNPYCRPRR